MQSGKTNGNIPKLVHIFNLKEGVYSSCLRNSSRPPKFHLQNWNLRAWSAIDIRGLLPLCICQEILIDKHIGMDLRGAILRYEILRLYGGMFLHSNFVLFKSPEEIMLEECLHVGMDSQRHVRDAILVSPKNHPFWNFALDRLLCIISGDDAYRTGQRMPLLRVELSTLLCDYIGEEIAEHKIRLNEGCVAGWIYEKSNLVVWPHNIMFQYCPHTLTQKLFTREEFPSAYGSCMWSGTWNAEQVHLPE